MLRCQAVSRRENPHSAFHRQRGANALGIVQIPAGIAAAMQIEHNALPAFILWNDPGPGKIVKGMIPNQCGAPVTELHQFSDPVLPFSQGFQRAVSHQRQQDIQLCTDGFGGHGHNWDSFRHRLIITVYHRAFCPATYV